MGTAPPPDAPSPADQDALAAGAGFDDSGPPAAELCGFTVPFAFFSLGFNLPPLSFPPALPVGGFGPALGLNCSTSNPIDVTLNVPYGGGRVGTGDPDPDLAFDQAS